MINILITIVLILLCGCNFDWTPEPYSMSTTFLINAEGEMVLYTDPSINEFTCFHEDNLAELKAAIDRVNRENDSYLNPYED